MKRNIELYIGGKRVDLNDNSFILFNYTFEDLSNPTAVKNSFSKSITLPGTANNNSLFGHYYKVDRVTQYHGEVGANFDAMKRVPFVIYDEKSEIVESGYAKLDKVQINGANKDYQVTLFGNLGLFFYNMTAKEDGSAVSLADLDFINVLGNITPGEDILVDDGAKAVSECWKYLADPDGYDASNGVRWANVLTFAPMYNGIPTKDFNADRTLKSDYNNIPFGRTIDGVYYSKKAGAQSVLTIFSNPHSEWELKELRWYLQRPAVSIRAIFDAICMPENNGGFAVELDSSFFNPDNHIYWDGWVTLPMISLDKRNDNDVLVKALKNSLTPAEYLISFAKMTGLVFVVDKSSKKVTIKQRKNFFSAVDGIVDLTNRVNKQSITITPNIADSRIYEFGNKNVGEFATAYLDRYGKEFGIKRVNTGNEFSNETKVVTDSIKYADAVEVVETNLLFYSDYAVPPISGLIGKYFRLPLFESVKTQLWNDADNSMQEIEVTFEKPVNSGVYPDNVNFPGADWLPKLQMHKADNKEVNGANVLMIFNGVKDTPQYVTYVDSGVTYRAEYSLTKDSADMDLLNEGIPCWGGETYESLTRLPSFRRSWFNGTYITEVCEWGLSEERSVLSFPAKGNITLYDRFWKNYLTDRYDDDTIMMSCKVDLSGMQVGQPLLGRFFYYEGAVFVLNKINNYSMTTFDDVECEFIKVQNKENYTE